ncbi:MAG: HAMP domain-containing histidine kinase [Planctomycetes bacterium]|nr:HAMP domain-containing histidine kinase [Planctomycetota bacterium]
MGRRFLLVALALGLSWALVVLLGALAVESGIRYLRHEREEDFVLAGRRVRAVVQDRFRDFLAQEERRPYYHYQFFFVPETVAGGAGLARSPLGDAFENGFAGNYFQVDEAGRLSTPYLNPDAQEANERLPDLDRRQQVCADLARTVAPWVADGLEVLAERAPREVSVSPLEEGYSKGQDQSYQTVSVRNNLDPAGQARFWKQNRAQTGANIYAQTADPAPAEVEPQAEEETRVQASPFWSLATPAGTGARRVFLVRQVDLGERAGKATTRRLVQGFELDTGALATRVLEVARDLLGPGMGCRVEPSPAAVGGVHRERIDVGAASVDLVLEDLDPGRVGEQALGRRGGFALAALALGGLLVINGFAFQRAGTAQARLERRRAEFLSAVSHELRTPLTSLLLHADLLAKGRVKGDPARSLDVIRQESARLGRLVENVLAADRLERGEAVRLAPRPGDLGALAARVLETFGPRLDQSGVRSELQVEQGLGPVVFDPDAMTQVLYNLLDNALEHGCVARPGSRIAVRVQTTADGRATLSVEDDGAGIPPEDLPHLFEPLRRGGRATSARRGIGLGLALVRSFVEAHGGTVSVRPGPGGRGTSARVELPADAQG